MTRDPRTDPRPGDVVKFWTGTERAVTRIGPTTVHYQVGRHVSSMSKRQWARMAESATVTKRGDDE